MKKNVFLFLALVLSTFIYAQPYSTQGTTIGLLYGENVSSPPMNPLNTTNNPSQIYAGYTLYSDIDATNVYLIDMCGSLVNE